MKQAIGILEESSHSTRAPVISRYPSLDIFRGATICLMILVNTPGKGAMNYSFLIHAKWLGFTLADLVFPSFLFAVGNSMSFTMRKMELLNDSDFLLRIGRRAAIIFLLGFLMYWFPFVEQSVDGTWIIKPLSETRIMGVLQRIALCYCSAALIIRYLNLRATIVLGVIFLILYWIILYAFGNTGDELSIGGNAVAKLDLILLGDGHIYKKDVVPFDPEGLLSTMPAIVNVLAGYWTGLFLQRNQGPDQIKRLVLSAVAVITLALAWGLIFPISKKLWTSSFALYTIGWDILILGLLIYSARTKQVGPFNNFFAVFGRNSLFIYLLSELLYTALMTVTIPTGESVFEWISIHWFQAILPGTIGAFTTGVFFMLVCWVVAWWLDRKNIFIRI